MAIDKKTLEQYLNEMEKFVVRIMDPSASQSIKEENFKNFLDRKRRIEEMLQEGDVPTSSQNPESD